jgi:DNA-binding NarL/FixJ family response regulator
MIKIFIIDDHQLFIDGLKMLLSQVKDFEVVGEALSGEEGIKALDKIAVDVLITDYSMEGMSGLEVVKYVRTSHPKIRIITLTMHTDIGFIDKMINAGSLGYLLKNTGRKELIEAIEMVNSGQPYYSPKAKEAIINRYTTDLTPEKKKEEKPSKDVARFTIREKQVLKLMVAGLPSKEIADVLCMSYHTVATHRRNINFKISKSSDLTVNQYVKAFGILDD